MPLDPADEPPIDTSLHHYMEDKALAIAMAKAETVEQKAKVGHLLKLQASLMVRREAFTALAIARRHARGEIYSKARVAAIHAMGPGRAAMDSSVKSLYQRQPHCEGVLKVHVLTHFTSALASQRIGIALLPADIASESRSMLEQEETFAVAWIAAVDSLADERGIKPLSNFIAFGEEGEEGAVPAHEILSTVMALLEVVADPALKFPSRKNALALLGKLRDWLEKLDAVQGRACFEVDT